MEQTRDCLFCKIIEGVIPASLVFQDEFFICIRDVYPQAKIHLLLIPKMHISSLDTAFPDGGESQYILVGKLFEAAAKVARLQGLLPGGFRSIINTEKNGGQTVFHLHLHLLGGELLGDQFG